MKLLLRQQRPRKKKKQFNETAYDNRKDVGERRMKRVAGYTLFWIAVGMLISLFISNTFWTVLLIFFLLLVGYNLFLC